MRVAAGAHARSPHDVEFSAIYGAEWIAHSSTTAPKPAKEAQ